MVETKTKAFSSVMVFCLDALIAPRLHAKSTTLSTNERLSHFISHAEEHVRYVARGVRYSSVVERSQSCFIARGTGKTIRHVNIKTKDVLDVAKTSAVAHTGGNNTIPHRVVRNTHDVSHGVDDVFHLWANNSYQTSHRNLSFLHGIPCVGEVVQGD